MRAPVPSTANPFSCLIPLAFTADSDFKLANRVWGKLPFSVFRRKRKGRRRSRKRRKKDGEDVGRAEVDWQSGSIGLCQVCAQEDVQAHPVVPLALAVQFGEQGGGNVELTTLDILMPVMDFRRWLANLFFLLSSQISELLPTPKLFFRLRTFVPKRVQRSNYSFQFSSWYSLNYALIQAC